MPHPKIDMADAPTQRYRYRGLISPQEAERSGARAEVTAIKDGNTAVLRIYDVLDSWGEFWGISAKEVISALDDIGEVESIQVRINSPGGEATEGVAIYNALVDHPARIDVFIDSLAASAASIVAMAGDSITMLTGSELMIHDPWLICMGNEDDMSKTANLLAHVADNLATVYAERAGGSASKWRTAMKEETWYSPDEALAAGLATAVAKKRGKSSSNDPKASFDLSVFNHAGRADAPAPRNDTALSKSRTSFAAKQDQENHRMNPEHLQALGLGEDATDEQITARLEALTENETPASTEPEPDNVPDDDPEDEPDDTPAPPLTDKPQASFEVPKGAVLVDEAQWQQVQSSMATLARMQADTERQKRDVFILAAMTDGKFAPAQRKHYEDIYDANPKAATALIDSLAKNAVPVVATGHGDDTDILKDDDAYPASWQNALRVKGANA